MKKILLLTGIAFLMFCMSASAQVKPFQFGFKLTPSIGWFSPDADGYDSDGGKMGFSWGFVSEIALTQNYKFVTGFSFNYLNGKMKFPYAMDIDGATETGTLRRSYNLQYIDLPLLIKMRTNDLGPIRFYGQIGFVTSVRLKANADDLFSYNGSSNTADVNVSDDFTLFKESMLVGFGVEYPIDESTFLTGGINFNKGLTNMMKGKNPATGVEQSATISAFEFQLGIIF